MEPDEGKMETPGEPEEESFGEMLDRSFVAPTRYEPGRKVSARVVKVTPEWVFLDLGRKGEGVLAAKELLDEAGAVRVKEGDALEAYFVSSDGSEMLFTTRVAGGAAGSAQLEEASNSGIPVDGVVVKEIKGGYEVRLAGGARAFCPHSQMDLPRSEVRRSASGSAPRSGSRSTGRRVATSSSPAGPCWKRRRSGKHGR